MSYYQNSYSVGDTFIDYSGNKYTVVTGGNTPSTPFNSSNIVNDKIVWGDLELEPLEQGGGQVGPVDSTAWEENTQYKVNNVVGYDGEAYICLQNHTSSNDFEADYLLGYWDKIDLPTVGNASYVQVLAAGVTGASSSKPYYKSLAINATNKFILPPIDVLQESTAESATITVSSFNSEDASKFNYDNDYVELDGNLHLKTEYNISMSTPTIITDGTNTGYISESDNIDFGDFANVEGVDVE